MSSASANEPATPQDQEARRAAARSEADDILPSVARELPKPDPLQVNFAQTERDAQRVCEARARPWAPLNDTSWFAEGRTAFAGADHLARSPHRPPRARPAADELGAPAFAQGRDSRGRSTRADPASRVRPGVTAGPGRATSAASAFASNGACTLTSLSKYTYTSRAVANFLTRRAQCAIASDE